MKDWTRTPRPCLRADRAQLAPQGIETVMPARTRPRELPASRTVSGALRHAVLADSKQGRRVTARYDLYALHGLGFLYLAGAWLWLKAKANTTWKENCVGFSARLTLRTGMQSEEPRPCAQSGIRYRNPTASGSAFSLRAMAIRGREKRRTECPSRTPRAPNDFIQQTQGPKDGNSHYHCEDMLLFVEEQGSNYAGYAYPIQDNGPTRCAVRRIHH